jgi:hypothetical protein
MTFVRKENRSRAPAAFPMTWTLDPRSFPRSAKCAFPLRRYRNRASEAGFATAPALSRQTFGNASYPARG